VKTIVISDYGVKLRFRKGVFRVESRDRVVELNPLEVEQIVIATGGVSMSSKVVRKAVEYGIDLVVLDSRGYPIGHIYPVFINKTVDTRRAQYRAYYSGKAVDIIREIVYAKIANQAGLLKRYYYYTRINELREAYEELIAILDRVIDVSGALEEAREKLRLLEAEAARIYWPSYSILLPEELGFSTRDQDSPDPVNTTLNYGYGILYGECWKILVLAGLDPYAGFMHVDRSGKPVLVFDFIEMYRFTVDYTLLVMYRKGWKPEVINGILDYKSRSRIISSLNSFLEKQRGRYIDEKPRTIRQIMKKSAFMLASHLRGEGLFKGFVWDW